METKSKIAVVGLGDMGTNLALKLHRNKYPLALYNRSPAKHEKFRRAENIYLASHPRDLIRSLTTSEKRAIVWMMLPGGEVTNNFVSKIAPYMRKGDIIIDGSNSAFKDSISNYTNLKGNGIHYLDVGCAGGPKDMLDGTLSLMIGGGRVAFERVENIFKSVADNGKYAYLGESGSGHKLKFVHNLIFYGIFPIYAESTDLLYNMTKEQAPNSFNFIRGLETTCRKPGNKRGHNRSDTSSHFAPSIIR